MKRFVLVLLALLLRMQASAQPPDTSERIDGGKTLSRL